MLKLPWFGKTFEKLQKKWWIMEFFSWLNKKYDRCPQLLHIIPEVVIIKTSRIKHKDCAGRIASLYNHSGSQSGGFSENWTWYYPEDVSTCNKNTCSTMFIAAFIIIGRSWKEPRWHSTEEWIQKMWFIYTVEYYSAIKNEGILSFAGKWMELENMILSEVTQTQRTCMKPWGPAERMKIDNLRK